MMANEKSKSPNGQNKELKRTQAPAPQPTPPDGGWGWVIVVFSFISNMIVDGILYTFGILYVELLIEFPDAGKGQIALIGSLLSGLYLIGGPIVSACVNKFGCRAVAIAGSIITATAFIISSFAKSVDVLLAAYGVFGGFGFGMLYMPSIIMVSVYFDKRRAMATGIAVCGSGIGTFVFAPLVTALNDEYGWRGTTLILGGIMLNGIACGAVYWPLKANKAPQPQSIEAPPSSSPQLPVAEAGQLKDQPSVEHHEEPVRPFDRLDVFYTGSVTNLNEYKASSDMASYISSVTSIPPPQKKESPVLSVLTTMFDFKLLLSPTFLFLCLGGVLGFMGFFTPFVYIADYSKQQGVNPQQASLLLAIAGISSTISRLVAGWMADRTWADSVIIHNIAIIVAGAATCLLPLLKNAPLLFLFCIVFGVNLAAFIALRTIVLCDLLGVQKLTSAFGLLVLFQGIAILIGTYLSGVIYDSTGSYTASFVVAGIFMIMAGVVCLPIRRIARWEDARVAKKKAGGVSQSKKTTDENKIYKPVQTNDTNA